MNDLIDRNMQISMDIQYLLIVNLLLLVLQILFQYVTTRVEIE